MKRIAIDMDEVMADTIGHCLALYNHEFNRQLTIDHLHGRPFFDALEKEHRTRVREYFEQAEFFANIPPMPGSREAVEALTSRYEVFIATAAMDVPCSFSAKFNWLQEHFPFIPTSHIVFCGDKSIIAADFLLDDNVRHLANFHGEGIIFTAPHNVNEKRFRRVNDWSEVRELFLSPSLVAV